MFNFNLGLSNYDIALIYLCPIGAVIGSFAHGIVESIHLDGPPKEEGEYVSASKELAKFRGRWLYLRMLLGGILGLVLGLYFIGAIQETPATLSKIIALSILVGYSAPNLWIAQDKILAAKFKELVNSELNKKSDEM